MRLEICSAGYHFGAESGHTVYTAFDLSEIFACGIELDEFI